MSLTGFSVEKWSSGDYKLDQEMEAARSRGDLFTTMVTHDFVILGEGEYMVHEFEFPKLKSVAENVEPVCYLLADYNSSSGLRLVNAGEVLGEAEFNSLFSKDPFERLSVATGNMLSMSLEFGISESEKGADRISLPVNDSELDPDSKSFVHYSGQSNSKSSISLSLSLACFTRSDE
jgi:hypothetical protein